jgi:hypothetical protein
MTQALLLNITIDKEKGMIKKIIFMTALMFAVAATAQAYWYMELTNADGTLVDGEFYTMDINFVTDDPTDNPNDFFLTIDYDETLVSYAGYIAQEYDDGGFPVPTTIWTCLLPETDNGDVVYNLMGTESLDTPGEFIPGAGSTLLGTVYWSVETSGSFTDIGVWADGPVSDLISVNNAWDGKYQADPDFTWMYSELTVTKVGDTYQIAPVPVPAAVWLLGSGLLGLIGVRRRKN